jgi:chemotaxis protein MotB
MRSKSCVALMAALLVTGCVSQRTYDRERQLNQQLQAEVQSDQVEIKQLEDRLRITIEDKILYPEAQASLTRSGRSILDKLVPTLQDSTDHRIEVEGYTDDVPIGRHLKSKYKTNWELSAARAAGVVEYLQKKGIDPSRMTAAGHGQYQPEANNETATGRAENRRTDIDLVPIYNQK